jgi:hypothetical protein
MTTHCHVELRKIARDMAGAMYEIYASDQRFGNAFYKRYPNSAAFVRRYWKNFVEPARSTLTQILRTPGNEALKETAAAILIADNPLRYGRMRHGPAVQLRR